MKEVHPQYFNALIKAFTFRNFVYGEPRTGLRNGERIVKNKKGYSPVNCSRLVYIKGAPYYESNNRCQRYGLGLVALKLTFRFKSYQENLA